MISGEGIQPQRVLVRIQGQSPLLLDRLGSRLMFVAFVCGAWACIAMIRRMRAARFQSDQQLVVTPKAPIPNLIEVEPHRGGGMKLIPLNDAACTLPNEKRPRRYRARQAIDIPHDVSLRNSTTDH